MKKRSFSHSPAPCRVFLAAFLTLSFVLSGAWMPYAIPQEFSKQESSEQEAEESPGEETPKPPDYIEEYGGWMDYCDAFREQVTIGDIQTFLEQYRGPLKQQDLGLRFDLDSYDIASQVTFFCPELAGAADMTPAEIIYWCSRNHDCNPVLLLTALQNEQSLVEAMSTQETTGYTLEDRLRRATGYDGPRYYGFFGQLLATAWQYRTYRSRGLTFLQAYETYTPPINGARTFSQFAPIYVKYSAKMTEIIEARLEREAAESDGLQRLTGDLDGNGVLTNADTLLLLQMIGDGAFSAEADCNGDGRVDNLDLLWLLRSISENSPV